VVLKTLEGLPLSLLLREVDEDKRGGFLLLLQSLLVEL
jgi:hypothetical protein